MTGTVTEIFESEGHPILGLLDGIRSEMVGDQVVLGLAEGGFDIFYACEDGTIELQHVNCPTNNANDIREVFRRLCVENGLIAATGKHRARGRRGVLSFLAAILPRRRRGAEHSHKAMRGSA
jgi:hypothetical protein